MHQNNDFTLYTKVYNYYSYVREYVSINIPNVHRDIRIHLLDESYSLVRHIYADAYTKGNVRMKNIAETLITISMLDMLSRELIEICPKNKKHIITSIGMLAEIKNMIYAWKNNEETN